jgi:hypothetical protein
MNEWSEETVYLITNVTSILFCVVFGILLLDMRDYRRFIRRAPVFPLRYVMARRTLGIAYLVIGGLMAYQVITGQSTKQDEFLPFVGLIISSSQAMLFTGALLALYNSRLLRRETIWTNIIPVGLFLVVYAAFFNQQEVQLVVRKVFFAFYIIQLMAYTIVFFMERAKYLDQIEEYFDEGKNFDLYSNRGVTALFLCSLAIGVAALASYFFTELWQFSVFIAFYTLYYIIIAFYFLRYAWRSQKIKDVTTPEEWSKTEKYKKEL